MLLDPMGEIIGWANFDEACTATAGHIIYCLRVSDIHLKGLGFRLPREDTASYNVLLLRRIEGTVREYSRVGLGEIRQLNWFSDGVKESISII